MYEVQQLFIFGVFLFCSLFLFVSIKPEVIPYNITELFAVLLHQRLNDHLVQSTGEIKHFIATGTYLLTLRQTHGMLDCVCSSIVNHFLAFRHLLCIFLQGNLPVLRGIEQQQVSQKFLVHAIFIADTCFEMNTEIFEKLLIFRPVLAHQFLKLILDTLLNILANDFQLSVMLQDLTGNIQRQIRRIDNTLDKLEIVVHQFVALFHDHYAVAVKRDALFVFSQKIEIIILTRNKEHCLIGNRTFCINTYQRTWILLGVELLFIEVYTVLI